MTGVGQDVLGESTTLPKEWAWEKLGKIARLRRDSLDPQDACELRYVGLEHIEPGKPKLRNWGDPSQVRSAKTRFCAGDVLYGKLRPYLDKSALAEWEGICSTDILALVAGDSLDAEFLSYAMHTRELIEHAVATTSGVNHPRTSWSSLAEFRVPLPPLAEQRAIAHVLRTVQDAIEAAERVIASTKELKRSLMRHLFTYGPVPIQEVHRVPLKETEIGPVPEHWCVSAFGQVVTIESGQVDPKQAPYRNMLHIGPENVESGTGRIADLATAESLSLKSGKYLFGPQHVVYSKIRPYLAKVAAPDFAGICSADMYPLRPASEQLDKDFLFHYMLTDRFTAQAVSFQSRTGIPKINRTQLNSIPVPLPPVSEQRLVSSYLRVVTDKLLREIRSHQSTGVLFSSLLHNLMTGKVRVSEFASPETQEVM